MNPASPAAGNTDLTQTKAVRGQQTPPRQVTAVARFRGGPGREDDAAQAWAFELTYYFTRGVTEPPQVTYADGIYTCTGLMQTTHPGDHPVTDFTRVETWELDFSGDPGRQQRLREMYEQHGVWFDGRDHAGQA
jgi:hypothetical protein